MTTLCSYDLNGKKLSFANWISNLSPQETPFTSMTGKESINQTLFQWQTDSLAKAGDNAQAEGTQAAEGNMSSTAVKSNITQILRKTVKVSDTANVLANYGRGRELQYQMEKAGKEIKRDLEWAFLNNDGSKEETPTSGRETAGFHGLVAPFGTACPETGAVVHSETTVANAVSEADIFGLTYNLYLSGSRADIIMFHPKWASVFSALQEKAVGGEATRQRIFENTPKFSVHVSTLVDPLGQVYKLIPNRWMPEGKIYFLNTSDWTQMVLRAPTRTKLAKDGSYEKWMIEMEVGLRHRHPFASGILGVKPTSGGDHSNSSNSAVDATTKDVKFVVGGSEVNVTDKSDIATSPVGSPLKIKGFKSGAGVANQPANRVSILKDGNEIWSKEAAAGTAVEFASAGEVVINSVTKADAGLYSLQSVVYDAQGKRNVFLSKGLALSVSTGDSNNPGNVQKPILVAEDAPVRKTRAKKA